MNDSSQRPLAVTDRDFGDQVLRSDQPVLVDFWAEWCGPCRVLGPVIDSLSQDYQGRVRVAKVDVDANQEVAARYGIRSIPTVILFDKGQIVKTFVGVRPKSDYAAAIDKAVA
ncbi:MAG TPA: thioredoxin [Woeseiaceae bacterium]|nr:thioredoxin [Woeseiaceae bacterium]